MLLSALYKQLEEASDQEMECLVFLAEPDTVEGDDIDAFVVHIGDIQVDNDRNEIRLIPRASDEDDDEAVTPLLLLGMFMQQMPTVTQQYGDYRLLAELPLERTTTQRFTRSIVQIESLHIGINSGEAWFLVRPAAEYGAALPN